MLGFGRRGWDLGLEAGIWALRLGFGPRGWDLAHKAESGGGTEKEEKKEKEEEKFPLCESIGHRPLWGRCPKAEAEMQQRQSWADLEAFQEAERIYDACDLDYAPADKKQKI